METQLQNYSAEFLPDGCPPFLYKFFPITNNLFNALEHSYLWHSSRTQFNDPFDCYDELLYFSPDVENVREMYRQQKNLTTQQIEIAVSNFIADPSQLPAAYHQVKSEVIDAQGICCFTSNIESNLMWSHYANNHRGVALVYEPGVDLEHFMMAKVRYQEEFMPRNYFEQAHIGLMYLLTTKSKEWDYEQEYRTLSLNHTGAVPISKGCLKQVIFGCKSSEPDRLKIIDLIEKSGYKNILYKQAEMNKTSFKLSFKQVYPNLFT